MNRREWLIKTSSTDNLKASIIREECRNDLSEFRHYVRYAAVLEDKLNTWKRETLFCFPHSEDKFISQLKRQNIPFCRSEHVLGMFQVDFRNVSDGTWNMIKNMINTAYLAPSIKTDSDTVWGGTARLSPTTQKMKARR